MKKQIRTLETEVTIDECIRFFMLRGYYIHEESDRSLTMHRPGTIFTASINRTPLIVDVENIDKRTHLSLRYGTWILFDTGDLSKEVDRLKDALSHKYNDL